MQYMHPFYSLPFKCSEQLLCLYANATSQMQILQIVNIPNWKFERVIFPGQRLVFEAVPNAQLQIYTCITGSPILLDRIACNCLRINEGTCDVHEALVQVSLK